jgi:hypothetical protein
MAVRCKGLVCDLSIAVVEVSNPAEGTYVRLVCLLCVV